MLAWMKTSYNTHTLLLLTKMLNTLENWQFCKFGLKYILINNQNSQI